MSAQVAQLTQVFAGISVMVIYVWIWHKNYPGAFPDVPALKKFPLLSEQTKETTFSLGSTARRAREQTRKMIHVTIRDVADSYRLLRDDFPDTGTFLVGLAIMQGGISSFATLGVVYMSQFLDMSPTQIVLVIYLLFLIAAPSGVAAKFVLHRYGARKTFLAMIQLFIASNVAAFFALTGPSTAWRIYILTVVWGSIVGLYFSANTALYTQLVPKHAESYFMSLFYFASVILTWLPPAVFTVLNQLTNALRYIFFITGVFYCIALPILYQVDIDRAKIAISIYLPSNDDLPKSEDASDDDERKNHGDPVVVHEVTSLGV